MGQVVTSDQFLARTFGDIRTRLNTTSRLRLFKSAHNAIPADTLSSYIPIEADFDSYSIRSLAGSWTGATQLVSGDWELAGPSEIYASPMSIGNNLYGLFVDDGAGVLLFSQTFDFPLPFPVGSPPLTVKLILSLFARSILP